MSVIGAIEAGGTKFVLAVATPGGAILARARIKTTVPAETMAEACAFFRDASASHGPLAGIGVGSFGPVVIDPSAPDYGTITTTPKPGWSGFRYQDGLAEFGVPVVVDTDVNGAALGEYMAGAAQGQRTIAYTTVGTGIGTGLLHDGQPMSGFSHYEAGHVPMPHDHTIDPFAGSCPFHGDCLEGLASGPAIKARWGKSLDELGPDETKLIASYLGDFAAMLVLTHMPDRLVFGGGVMKAPGLLDAMRTRAEKAIAGYVSHERLTPGLADYIVPAGLGDDAGITGAIELARRAAAL
jgi:fructokinase